MSMSDEPKKSLRCSFCGKREAEVRRKIQGPGARICDQCVQLCMSVLEDELGGKTGYVPENLPDRLPTPREIRQILDQYVIGQENAKTALSVAVYNH